MPALWLYGGVDKEVPPDQSVALLQRLKETMGKDFTVVVYPEAGHGLLDAPPTNPRALPTLIRWVRNRVHVPST